MTKLTCISWNIRGINPPIKRKKILTYLKKQKVDIASHLTDNEILKLWRDWVGNVFYSSFSTKARGVALLINKNLNLNLNSVENDKSGRFLLVNCEINRNKIALGNIYRPNYDDPLFFNNLIMKEGQYIVGGDFKMVLNPLLDLYKTEQDMDNIGEKRFMDGKNPS
uniref:Endonuclease/exonuclease/phosphatase domain-containing protein n=1 Tax=Cyprinodon variegatus TaxID=28743 RepID=A0A3Q2EBS1_CYPVA